MQKHYWLQLCKTTVFIQDLLIQEFVKNVHDFSQQSPPLPLHLTVKSRIDIFDFFSVEYSSSIIVFFFNTVVGVCINTMKTTFKNNFFDL